MIKAKKVLTIGGAMRDVFIQYQNVEIMHLDTPTKQLNFVILEEGRKIEVDQLAYHTGGGATNSAVSFKRLGFDVSSFFKIGSDQEGEFIVSRLKKEGINLDHIVRSTEVGTGNSFIIPSSGGNRSVLVYRGANLTLTAKELPLDAIAACDQLYITSLSHNASELLPVITAHAKKHNKPVAVNPGTSQLTARVDTLQTSLKNIDILILNCFEASLLMNALAQPAKQPPPELPEDAQLPKLLCGPIAPHVSTFTLQHYFKQVLKAGPKIAVVTNGAEGVYATDGKKIYFHPSLDVDVVSTLGAGDSFGSTFVAQLLDGKPIEQAIQAGIINSASVIQYLDTTTGLLDTEALERRKKATDISLLQTFALK